MLKEKSVSHSTTNGLDYSEILRCSFKSRLLLLFFLSVLVLCVPQFSYQKFRDAFLKPKKIKTKTIYVAIPQKVCGMCFLWGDFDELMI